MTNWIGRVMVTLILTSCGAGEDLHAVSESGPVFEKAAILDNRELKEVSGIQAGSEDVLYVHNDSGGPIVHVIDLAGRHQGQMRITEGKNRDWEDITSIPGDEGRILVLGDIGDNDADHKTIRLYFIKEPSRDADGNYPPETELLHRLKAKYPDGPRDAEAMAYDPASGKILILTKRDKYPRLYGISAETAFSQEKAKLEFLGELPKFRPPTPTELLTSGKRGQWLNQATGMDISADGRLAAVISYRSLYLFSREEGETWIEAFQREPLEVIGPKGLHDEAVTFSQDGKTILVSTERLPTPLYRLSVPEDL